MVSNNFNDILFIRKSYRIKRGKTLYYIYNKTNIKNKINIVHKIKHSFANGYSTFNIA